MTSDREELEKDIGWYIRNKMSTYQLADYLIERGWTKARAGAETGANARTQVSPSPDEIDK